MATEQFITEQITIHFPRDTLPVWIIVEDFYESLRNDLRLVVIEYVNSEQGDYNPFVADTWLYRFSSWREF